MMTALSAAALFEMEYLHDDNMELASSPHMPADDLDLDFGNGHEPESGLQDSMVEDVLDNEHVPPSEHSDDDEMVDEDTEAQQYPENASDLNMDRDQDALLEDEDILYEDDENTVPEEIDHFTQQNTGNDEFEQPQAHTEPPSDKTEPHNISPEDPLTSTIDDFGHYPSFPTEDPVIETNEELHQQLAENDQHDQSQTDQVTEEEHAIHNHSVENPTNGSSHESNSTHQQFSDENTGSRIDESALTANTNQTEPAENTDSITQEDFVAHVDLQQLQNVALHPVKVIYQDSEIYLFSPQTNDPAETFFLSDDNLAHENLEKLLSACRDVLAGSIGDDDELVLDIVSLGLHISEGTKYATEITLSQILDVYLTLARNESLDPIEPLYCNLSSRVCLQTQYAYLASAAQEGKTISEIIAEHMDSPEVELFDEQHEFVEQDHGDNDAQYESTEVAPATTEIEAATHRQDHSQDVGETHNAEPAAEHEENEGSGPAQASNDTSSVDYQNNLVEETDPKDEGVNPPDTEYREDIDEVVLQEEQDQDRDRDRDQDQDQEPPAGDVESTDHLDDPDRLDENTSSGTVEADVLGNEENYFEETEYYDENYTEVHPTENLSIVGELETAEMEEQTHIVPPVNEVNKVEPNGNNAEDYLDLGLEDEAEPRIAAPNIEDDNDEGFEYAAEASADADASTDQTLEYSPQEDELDAFLPPTPAKTRNAKRKVAPEDDDDLGLLDTATPEKKRRRPS